MKQAKYIYALLGLVLVIAFVVRLVKLDAFPPALNWDEVSHGYNAFAIGETGADEWGFKTPLIFRAFGDYKLPVYIYATVPWVQGLGLNAWSVRITSVLGGGLFVAMLFLLTRQFGVIVRFKSDGVKAPWNNLRFWEGAGLMAAFIGAISPWPWFLSRIAVEANLAIGLITSGVYFFLLGIEQMHRRTSKSWAFFASGLLLGLSLFTYNSARIFVPVLMILLLWIFQHEFEIRKWLPRWLHLEREKEMPAPICSCHLTGIAIFLLFVMGMVMQMSQPEGQARLNIISVLDQGAINQIEHARNTSGLPGWLIAWVHNRPTFLMKSMVANFFSYFDLRFWFMTGGDHYQFSVPNFGLLHSITAPLLFVGLGILLKAPREVQLLLLGWMLLAPIPALPTRDNPHTLRIITMMPIPFVLTGLGAAYTAWWLKLMLGRDRVIAVACLVFAVGLGFSIKYYWQMYQGYYPVNYYNVWQYGSKEMVGYVKEQYPAYDQIFISKKYGEVHEFILFYWPWDPRDYQMKRQWDYHDNWYWVNGFDKFVLFNDWEVMKTVGDGKSVEQKALLVTSPKNVPHGWKLVKIIRGLDGNPIYEIYEN